MWLIETDVFQLPQLHKHFIVGGKQFAVFHQVCSDKSHIFDFCMLTLNTILKELKNVPVDRLEDLYSIIHSLQANTRKSDKTSNKILSFAGSFGDMTENDYNDFLQHTKQTRNDLFDRDINL